MAKLSLYQEALLRNLSFTVKKMSKEQLEEQVISLTEVMILKENAYKQFILERAGMASPTLGGGDEPEN